MLRKIAFIFLFFIIPSFAFAEPSIKYIRKHAVPFRNPRSLPSHILKAVKHHPVIPIGEIHGTNEAPEFVLALVQLLQSAGNTILLGLEIPMEEQPALDEFLKTGNLTKLKESPFFQRDYQDGRSSQAMAKLLDGLRFTSGVRIIAFDATNASSGQERDEKMAINLTKAYQSNPTDYVVFLAGNIHSSIGVGTPFDPKYRPMGYQLIHQQGAVFREDDFLPLKVRNEVGETWCCLGSTVLECKVQPMNFGATNYSSAVPWSFYFLKETTLFEGYKGSVFMRRISASHPLKAGKPE